MILCKFTHKKKKKKRKKNMKNKSWNYKDWFIFCITKNRDNYLYTYIWVTGRLRIGLKKTFSDLKTCILESGCFYTFWFVSILNQTLHKTCNLIDSIVIVTLFITHRLMWAGGDSKKKKKKLNQKQIVWIK